MIIEIEDLREAKSFDNATTDDESEFQNYLDRSYNGRNSFWLRRNSDEYPSLNIAIVEDLATANYFALRSEQQSDWVSKSDLKNIDPNKSTIFYYNNEAEEQEMTNSVVISYLKAIQVAKEFFRNPLERPSSIEWLEL